MSKKYCYLFTEGNANMRELLGGKGANLAEMTNIGLPVPQGFTITTEACTQYYEDGRQINDEIFAEIMEYVEKMEKMQTAMQKGFKQATGAWGKDLPDICQKTLDAANQKFEDYYKSKESTTKTEG